MSTRATRLGSAFGLASAGLGATGLLGLWLGATGLTTLLQGRTSFMPNTFLGLILGGLAVTLYGVGEKRRAAVVVAIGLGALLWALGVVTLVEYGIGALFDVDQLLFHVPGKGPHPGRPSPLTALAFSVLGAGLTLFDWVPGRKEWPAEWLLSTTGLLAFTGLVGHLYGTQSLYDLKRPPVVVMALPTAIALMLTASGALAVRPGRGVLWKLAFSEGPGGVMIRRLGLLAALGPVAVGFILRYTLDDVGIQDMALLLSLMTSMMVPLGLLLLGFTAMALDRTHHELEEHRGWLAGMFELTPDGIFVADLNQRYTDVNSAGCQLLGYSRDQIVGKTITELIPAEDAQHLWQVERELLRGKTHVGEWRLKHRDGHLVTVEISTCILPGGKRQAFVRDVSERKAAERDQQFLAEVGAVLGSTLDYQETGNAIAQLCVRFLSDCCILYLLDEEGQTRERKLALSSPFRSLAPREGADVSPGAPQPHLVATVLTSRKPVLVNQLTGVHLQSITRDSALLELLHAVSPSACMALPLMARNHLWGALLLLSADKDRKYGPRQLKLGQELALRAGLAVENAQLYLSAQKAIRARDEILSIVAHDLRNPINASQLAATALLRQRPDEARWPIADKAARTIVRSMQRANHLIQDLLEVTRIENGQLRLERTPVRPEELLKETREMFAGAASAAALHLESHSPDGAPELFADRDRLLQVFSNLMGNALKFTPGGGSIRLEAECWPGELRFAVADTGVGIPSEHLPHLFERFWQGGRRDRSGTGLGLPIAKGIVEAHGGHIWAKSTPGQGSTFYFTVPLGGLAQSLSGGNSTTAAAGIPPVRS